MKRLKLFRVIFIAASIVFMIVGDYCKNPFVHNFCMAMMGACIAIFVILLVSKPIESNEVE